MKLLLLLTFVALAQCNEETEAIKLAADSPQKLQSLFTQFRRDNSRVYKSPDEARMRMGIFRKFVKEASKINSEQEDVTVGITFFADLTEEEKVQYHGANITDEVGDDVEQYEAEDDVELTWGSSVSHKSRYGPIKFQGNCGSCWAFGAVGVTEGFQAMRTGRYTALSEQQVLDCSGAGNCNSGYHRKALNYIWNHNKLATGAQYKYRTRQQRCYANNYQNAMRIRVTQIWQAKGDRNLASAIGRGPVAVLLYNFHGVSVEGYKSGVLSPPNYGPGAQNHIVVAVGYRSDAWELRNSWGHWWGERGYFWHSRKKYNNIGVSDWAYTMNVANAGEEQEE